MPCVVDLLGRSVFSSLQAVVDLNAGVLDKLAKLLLISMHLHVCFCYDRSHCKGKEGQYGISRQGLLEHAIVMAGALMHMCAMCGALGQAQNVLQRLPSCVFVSWIALFAEYAQNGQGNALGSKAIAQVGP